MANAKCPVQSLALSKRSANVSRQDFQLFIFNASLICFNGSLINMQRDISFRCTSSNFINCLSTSLCPLSQKWERNTENSLNRTYLWAHSSVPRQASPQPCP